MGRRSACAPNHPVVHDHQRPESNVERQALEPRALRMRDASHASTVRIVRQHRTGAHADHVTVVTRAADIRSLARTVSTTSDSPHADRIDVRPVAAGNARS
jgi:hypothetical protein